jgi:hypothetical protein
MVTPSSKSAVSMIRGSPMWDAFHAGYIKASLLVLARQARRPCTATPKIRRGGPPSNRFNAQVSPVCLAELCSMH